MSQKKYPEEFKIEAVRQVVERGHPVAEVAARLGVSQHSLYKWIKLQQLPAGQRQKLLAQTEELRRLRAELKRVTEEPVPVHSDQGCQFTGHDWRGFLRDHNLVSSISRRGNCHDNAVAESFFQLLKRERIRRQIYPTRQDARADVFNYIEIFYNPMRRHSTAAGLSPIEFEKRHLQRPGIV